MQDIPIGPWHTTTSEKLLAVQIKLILPLICSHVVMASVLTLRD